MGANINFPELMFDEPGVYSYTVSELDTRQTDWIIDERVFRVIITVTDGGNGKLSAELEYPDGFPTFTNRKKHRQRCHCFVICCVCCCDCCNCCNCCCMCCCM